MKQFLAPIPLLILLFPSITLGETMDDLMKWEGIYYKKFTDIPFTGKVSGRTYGAFKNGKWDGPYIHYWKNGQLGEKGNYNDGKREGSWVAYYATGTLWKTYTGIYKNGKLIK